MARRRGGADLDQWFTPFWAAEELVEDALRDLGPCPLLEPSCGEGAFLAAFPADRDAMGIEIDPQLAARASALTGRPVLVGDYRTIDLAGREFGGLIGNPPFGEQMVEGLIERSHQLLPPEGLLATILPAYCFQTASRVTRWGERFSIDVKLIPRQLFPGMEKPLVWAKFRKTGGRRFWGLMLFREQRDLELMARRYHDALRAPGTWRECVRLALEALGGEASVAAIYDQLTPARRGASDHWRPKVRQTLQRHFRPVERGRWAL